MLLVSCFHFVLIFIFVLFANRSDPLVLTALGLKSDKHLISPHNITTRLSHTGHEKKGNDHQRQKVLMFNQILPTSIIRNIWRTVRRIWMLILGLKGLNPGKQSVLRTFSDALVSVLAEPRSATITENDYI